MRPTRVAAVAAVATVVAGAVGFGALTASGEGELPGQTFLVSSEANGTPMNLPFAVSAPSMSGDGRFVVWAAFIPCPGIVLGAQAPCGTSVQIKDRESGAVDSVDLATGFGDTDTEPVISRDGCTVVFTTDRSFTAQDGGSDTDIYAHDRCNPQSAPQLLTTPGALWFGNPSLTRRPAVSGNGRFVAFNFRPDPPGASNDLALVDRDPNGNGNPFDTAPAVQLVVNTQGVSPNRGAEEPALSDDGNRLVFASDYDPSSGALVTSGSQIWLLDRGAGVFSVVSSRSGAPGNCPSEDPAISGDGTVVAFVSQADNLTDIPVSGCPGNCANTFCARRLHARTLGVEPDLVTRNEIGASSNDQDARPALSFDGTLVAFAHFGEDLVQPPATQNFEGADIILVNRVTHRPTRISVNPGGGPTTLDNAGTAINDNGRFVGFLAGEAEEVIGADLGGEDHILVRDRAAVLSVQALDFGTVDVDLPPQVRTATVTNTHGATFEIAAISSDNGEFSVVGGSCAPGVRLAPAQSCTIDVAFDPGDAGDRSATLTISSVGGFDANPPASAPLSGSGQLPPTTTTEASTTTTAPETTTTAPGVFSLTIAPALAAFPSTIIGATSVAQAFTVRNTGNRSNTVQPASLTGANPADYLITSDACAGVSLQPNETCSVGAALRPTATGSRPATLRVDGSGGSSASATLAGDGASAPTLVLSPAVAKGGTVTTAIGGGFPASTLLSVTFEGQGGALSVTTDAVGGFRVSIVVRSGEVPGTLLVSVPGVPGQFETVSTPLLVVLGTYQPQTATGPAFGNSSILSRG